MKKVTIEIPDELLGILREDPRRLGLDLLTADVR
jgi:hypothetical protein